MNKENLINTNYDLYQIDKTNGDIFINDKYISNIYNVIKKNIIVSPCLCGKSMGILIDNSDCVELYICINCGRIHTIDKRFGMKFILPERKINTKPIQDEITMHNSGMVLDEKKEFVIGRANYTETIPLSIALKEDLEFKASMKKGYASYIKDEFNLDIGVNYNKIESNGRILYNNPKINHKDKDPFLIKLLRTVNKAIFKAIEKVK